MYYPLLAANQSPHMLLLGNLLSANRDYYNTLLGIIIVTDWQVIEMDAQKRIRKLMEERGWTDYRPAKEANLSHSTVTDMFNRNNAPALPALESVCRAFGITLAQFFAEGDEPAQMTEEQQILFSRWNPLTEEQKRLLLDLMKTM